MNKVYSYAALLISLSFLFQLLSNANFFMAFIVFIAMSFISSKIYKFQKGKELNNSYQKLPFVKFFAFLFKDKDILKSQNHKSLSVLLLSTAYGLSMMISFYLYGEEIKHFLLFIGCISFSIIFTIVFLNRYIQEKPNSDNT